MDSVITILNFGLLILSCVIAYDGKYDHAIFILLLSQVPFRLRR